MKNSCAYTLSTAQIFTTMFLPWMLRAFVIGTAALTAGAGIVAWMLYDEALDTDGAVLLIMAIGGATILMDLTVVLVAYLKARAAPPLPAGKTVLEWDELGLAATAGGKYVTVPWGNLEYRLDKGGGVTLRFPGGHYTYVSASLAGKSAHESLLRMLRQLEERGTAVIR